MFNTVLAYRFVQRNRSHTQGWESWRYLAARLLCRAGLFFAS